MPTHTQTSMLTITSDDNIILVMGKSGSGKSNFIYRLLTETQTQPVEARAEILAHMENVRAYAHYHNGQRFILVDTPGLSDRNILQGAAFEAIATWLRDLCAKSPTEGENSPKRVIELLGVIHTHSITDSNMSTVDVQSFELFRDLCGNEAADRVRLVMTMWDVVDESEGAAVEGTLETHWQSLTVAGARPARFNNTTERAWLIVESLENTKKALLLQIELVVMEEQLKDTTAGQRIWPERPDVPHDQAKGWFDNWIISTLFITLFIALFITLFTRSPYFPSFERS
ncbi:hypothetical protein F5141DRAFT_1293609 [Pisolithus sp. B1]|nr:hypothetical protein F5141DRAFT_1293609 [Pisolithus sp. B1]